MQRILNIIYYIFLISALLFSSTSWSAPRFKVVGLSGDELKNVEAHLTVIEQNFPESGTRDYIKLSEETIQKALNPYGFFKSRVSTQTTRGTMIFTVDPGPKLRIASISLAISGPGKNSPALQEFKNHLPLQSGQPFLLEKYEKTKEQLFQIAANEGYLKAHLEKKEIRINLQRNTADIILDLNTGPRYYFGHILFSPNPYSSKFLKRFVPFEENEPFSTEKLLTLKQNLINSNFFQQVDVNADINPTTENINVPINIAVTPPKSQRYDIGIGYGTFTGARLTLGTELRRVTDTGQHFNAQLKLSSVLSGLTAKYYIPGKNPLTDQYIIGGNVQYFLPKNGRSFSQTLSGSYQKKKGFWQNTYGINYLNESYKVEDKPNHISQVFYPNVSFSRIEADNLISPRSGSMFNFSMQGASETLFSKTSFFQAELKGKYIFSPTQYSRMIFRGDIGYTVVENLNQLPLTLRYFAGGMGSVRGYPYSTIGPGKYLQTGSAELQHKIYGDWSGAAFYDIGNASDQFNSNFKRGTGLGVIYQSFIGPVQLYVGKALSKKGQPYSLEFSIGPDF